MEPSIWKAIARFVTESHTKRIKETFSGYLMGFIGAQHFFFSGELATLVGPLWWFLKAIGTVVLAFFTSMATAYGAYLIEVHKENQKKSSGTKRKRNAA